MTLCKLDYPIYVCEVLDDSHIVVAGGGGASKTGVPNAVDILKAEKYRKNVQADPTDRLETGNMAVMNMSLFHQEGKKQSILAVGLGGMCKIYSVKRKAKGTTENMNTGLKHRKNNKLKNAGKEDTEEHFTFNLLKTLDTDFGSDPLQKSVRISRDGKLLVTGGSDGFVRAWNLLDFTKIFFAHGHKDDVTDVDISPDGQHVVSVSRDGTAVIWNAKTGLKETELHLTWNIRMEMTNYRFRCCRYGTVFESPKKYVLFTAHSPVRPGRRSDKTAPQGCLTKWAREKTAEDGPLCPTIIQFTGKEAVSSMSVSHDGVFLGVGFMEGSVAIYIAFSLQCAKKVSNAHGIFVTGTSFLPNSENSRAITGPCDAALISVSADNTCKMTKLSSRTLFPIWLALLMIFLALAGAAVLMFHLGII